MRHQLDDFVSVRGPFLHATQVKLILICQYQVVQLEGWVVSRYLRAGSKRLCRAARCTLSSAKVCRGRLQVDDVELAASVRSSGDRSRTHRP